jgi:hypothetical protein
MQRTLTVLFAGLVSSLILTGCPEKKAEKEAPATADDPVAADQSGAAEDKKKEEKAEEKTEKKTEAAEDKKDEKDEGGW